MNSNCFPNNFIPLKGDCATYTEPNSGLYINDLPGLSFKLLAQLSNEEQQTASALYQVSHAEGLRRFFRDFTMGMAGEFNYKNVLGSNRHGRLASTFDSAGTINVGKEIEKTNCWDRFQCTYIEYIEFNADQAYTDFDFTLVDGCVTTVFTQDLACGINRIRIDYEVTSDKAQLYYDSTLVLLPDNLQCWDTQSNCGCGGVCAIGGGYSGYSVKDITEDTGTITPSNIENGLVVTASTRCSTHELPCIFKLEAAQVVRRAIAIDIMERALLSDRNTTLIRNKKETLGEALVRLNGGVSEVTGFRHKGEYHKDMASLITQAKTFLTGQVNKTRCLSCSGQRIAQITP